MNAATGKPVASGSHVTEGTTIRVTIPSVSGITVRLLRNGVDTGIRASDGSSAVYTYTVGGDDLTFTLDTYIENKPSAVQGKNATENWDTAENNPEQYLQYTSDVSVIYFEGTYYMYAAQNNTNLPWTNELGVTTTRMGYTTWDWVVWTSQDLEHWTRRCIVATLDDLRDVWGFDCFTGAYNWAPDVYRIGGAFYMVSTYWCTAQGHDNPNCDVTYLGEELLGHRAIVIMKADSPLGPFRPVTELCTSPRDTAPAYETGTPGHITPAGQDCIDAIIWFDVYGQAWLVWSDESTNYRGVADPTVQAAKLSSDLLHLVSEPITLFRGKQIVGGTALNGTTDAPWLYTTASGEILMIWSSYWSGTAENSYCVVYSRYSGKTLDDGGTWSPAGILYDARDAGKSITTASPYYNGGDPYQASGGHAATVRTPDGQLYLTLHLHMLEQVTGDITRLKCPAFIAIHEEIGADGTTDLVWGFGSSADPSFRLIWRENTNLTYGTDVDGSVTVRRPGSANTSVGLIDTASFGTDGAWWAEVRVKTAGVYPWHTQGIAIAFSDGNWLILGAGIRSAADRTALRVAYLPNGVWGGQIDTLPAGAAGVCSGWQTEEYLTIRVAWDGAQYTVSLNGVSFGTFTPAELGVADFGAPVGVGIGCRMDAQADSETTFCAWRFAVGTAD